MSPQFPVFTENAALTCMVMGHRDQVVQVCGLPAVAWSPVKMEHLVVALRLCPAHMEALPCVPIRRVIPDDLGE